MNQKFCILIRILLKFVPKGPIDNKSSLVQVIAWCPEQTVNHYLSQCWPNSLTNLFSNGGDELKYSPLVFAFIDNYNQCQVVRVEVFQ